MSPSLVVVLEPWCQSCGAFVVAGEHLAVGPFGLEGPVEALYLAVLPGAVRPDGEVLGSESANDLANGSAFRVAPVVVGHDRLDAGYALFGEGLSGPGQEPPTGVAPFIGVDLGVGEAAVVVDR